MNIAQQPQIYEHSEHSPKREIHRNIGLPQKQEKSQINLTLYLKEIEENNKIQSEWQKEHNEDQSTNK